MHNATFAHASNAGDHLHSYTHTHIHTHTQWIATSATAHVLLQSGGESRALQTEWINKKQPRHTPADSENLHVYTRTLKHGLLHLGC